MTKRRPKIYEKATKRRPWITKKVTNITKNNKVLAKYSGYMKIRVCRNETRQEWYKKLYSRVYSYFIVCGV